MEPVRMGVIGCGRMGRNHCRVFANLAPTRLIGVYDTNLLAAQSVASQYEAHAYASVDALLDQVQAVSIATPTPQHYELAMHCLERGLHVFVEKPICETVAQAEALTAAAEASGLVVQVGHIERFNPAYTELKHVLDDMQLAAVNFRRLSAFSGSNTDVDVVLDLMIHDLDLVLDLAQQQPASITASGLRAFSNTIDHAVVGFCFASGPLLTVTASRITEHKVRVIDATALDAFVEADLLAKSISVHRRTIGRYLQQNHRGTKYHQESVVERIQVPIAEPLALELQHFAECIQQWRQPIVTARHGLDALRLAMTVRAKILRGMVSVERQPAEAALMALAA